VQQSNQRLFYRVLLSDPERCLPLVYTPTVGEACSQFGFVGGVNKGLYVSLVNKGHVARLLDNWPHPDVRAIVVTDGERILGLGDLGVNGMGIPVGKMALYTALGGIDPAQCLPITLDVGTDNEKLLEDPLYVGLRQRRERGPAYDELIEELIEAIRVRFGSRTLIQFEDFANRNAFRLLTKYREKICTFNDDIQGTASVSLSAVLSYCRATQQKLTDQRFVFFGAGSAGIGIADLLSYAISKEGDTSLEEARKLIFLVDSRGLITHERESGGVTGEKIRYAHKVTPMGQGLAAIVQELKATVLIGVSAIAKAFTQEVVQNMCANNPRPLICALSNPTRKAECTATEAYTWSDGKCIFCSGSPFDPVEYKGKTYYTSQCNNSYVFPGLALGVITVRRHTVHCIVHDAPLSCLCMSICCIFVVFVFLISYSSLWACLHSFSLVDAQVVSRRITDSFFYIAARAVAETVTAQDIEDGKLFPSLKTIRDVSLNIGTDVAHEAYDLGLATVSPKPMNMRAFIEAHMYDTEYHPYVVEDDSESLYA
jgi:malate dehydrogenase (oxaloacetate-decarboxylating)(NADP+)